jgi:Protein of unknown function (DUF3431)
MDYSPNLFPLAFMSFIVIIIVVSILILVLFQYGFLFPKYQHVEVDVQDLCSQLVIVTAHWKEDLTWLKESIWKVIVCDKEGADPVSIPSDESCLCPNIGRESSSYLKYIVTHYDHLAPFTAFIHGHEQAWHQRIKAKGPFKAKLLNAILAVDLEKHEFITLNECWIDDWKKGPQNWGQGFVNMNMTYLHTLWEKDFKPWLKIEAPKHLRSDCCSTFIVSKNLIQRLPKEAYEHWLGMFLEIKPEFYDAWSSKALGYCFEYLWHVIFGQELVRTPTPFRAFTIDGT